MFLISSHALPCPPLPHPTWKPIIGFYNARLVVKDGHQNNVYCDEIGLCVNHMMLTVVGSID